MVAYFPRLRPAARSSAGRGKLYIQRREMRNPEAGFLVYYFSIKDNNILFNMDAMTRRP
ncbi:hypothetical protein QSG27_21325 [Azospirillum sp. C340-1]|uniref:Uncharacterized protein n=1 Tax=Azospirillum isscasi TaxID=3053926 RepID=A0ABU0WLZ5_9PROT|nr:hypothetical protein [Azospirillum isscasi]